MKTFFLSILLMASTIISAQSYQNFLKWDFGKASAYNPSADEASYNAIVLEDDHKMVLQMDQLGQGLLSNELIHKKIYLHNDKGVEYYNTIYIGKWGQTTKLPVFNLRIVKADGTVIEQDKSQLKSIENTEESGSYWVYPIEGIEVGSTIEYYYVVSYPNKFWGTHKFQGKYPVKSGSFEFMIPKDSNGNAKYSLQVKSVKDSISYHDLEATQKFTFENVVPENEMNPTSFSVDEVRRVDYCMRTFENNFSFDYYTIAGNIEPYTPLNIASNKKLKKFFNTLQEDFLSLDDSTQLTLIDNYLKDNIMIADYETETDIIKILDAKTTSESGIFKVYKTLLNYANIPYYSGITSSKFEEYLDPKFATPTSLSKSVLYIPAFKTVVDPLAFQYRFPLTPSWYESNNILTVKGYEPTFVNVPTCNTFDHYLKRNATLDITDEEDYELAIESNMLGHETGYTRYIYFAKPNEMDDKQFIELYYQDVYPTFDITEPYTKGTALADISANKPLTIGGKFQIPDLFETVTEDIFLINVGKFLGPQQELYHKKTPIADTHIRYPYSYEYKFDITVPEDFNYEGLDDINIHKTCSLDEKIICEFKSWYEQNGNTVTVHIIEYYTDQVYPTEIFEDYKSVINAASDFSKVSILVNK